MRALRKQSSLFAATVFALLAFQSSAHASDKGKYLVYVGPYTNHGSRGIYAYRFDAKTGHLTSLGIAAESGQPTFLAVDAKRRFLYAANEVETFKGQPTAAASAFAIDRKTGQLTLLNELSSRTVGACHVALDRTGKYLLVANYAGGSVIVYPLLPNGSLGEPSAFIQHKGSSVNPQRQAGPHAHEVLMSPDNRFAIVPDLGLDQLIAYPFDSAKGTLGAPHITKVAPGTGPRHAVFSWDGKNLYLISELASTVTVFAYNPADASLSELQTISTLPPDFTGKSSGAEIVLHPSGRFLYASNRGHNSIATFAIGPDGKLTSAAFTPTGGKVPRNFAIDPSGKWLLVGNQDSGDVRVFRIDSKGGLAPNGAQVMVASPACILFVPLH